MRLSLAVLVAAAAAFSCAAPGGHETVTSYRSPGPGIAEIRRAVVVPFAREDPAAEFLTQLERTFISELQKERRFEVVPLSEQDAGLLSAAIRRDGRFGVEALLELSRRYRADAAVVGTVTRFRAYEPLALGLKAEIVSARTGEVVWSAEASFDCAEERTIAGIRRYHDAFGNRDQATDVSGWRHYTASVTAFTRFVCHEVAATLDCGFEFAPAR